MSRFQTDNREPEKPRGMELGGSFSCMACDYICTSAVHDPSSNKLSWVCPDGHVSTIDFRL